MVSNLGFCNGLWGTELVVAKPYESIKASGFCLKGRQECGQSVGYLRQKRARMINKDVREEEKNTGLNDTPEKCIACTQQVREGVRISDHTLGKLS